MAAALAAAMIAGCSKEEPKPATTSASPVTPAPAPASTPNSAPAPASVPGLAPAPGDAAKAPANAPKTEPGSDAKK